MITLESLATLVLEGTREFIQVAVVITTIYIWLEKANKVMPWEAWLILGIFSITSFVYTAIVEDKLIAIAATAVTGIVILWLLSELL